MRSCIFHSLKTCRDVTQKSDTWKAVGTKLIVLQFNFNLAFATDNEEKTAFYSHMNN